LNTVAWLLLLPACGALWALRQFLLYPARPGEWRYTFAAGHRGDRESLHGARLRKRTVEGEHRRRVSAAERSVAETVRRGRQRVRELERQRELLLRPGRGEHVAGLGLLRLHRHTLLFLKETPQRAGTRPAVDEELDLAGLDVETQFAPENSFIHLTRPDGSRRTAPYPRADYPETAVQDFANRIHNQALADEDFRAGQQARAAGITTEIEEAEADTAAKETTARRRITELLEAHRTDLRRLQADADWETECHAWHKLTGHRPWWWWRW
jgi:hypothetical protein